MEYKVEQVIKENRMYILNDEPFSLSVPEGVDTIYVPEGTAEGYKALNPTVSDYIKNYSYSNYRVTKPEFYDDVTIIMDKNTNAPVLKVMFDNGLCANENYMTLAEAKAVTNETLPSFEGNLEVTSFMEFQYFTGVTETKARMFFGAYNLERIELPKTIRKINERFCTFTNALLNAGNESKLKYVGGCENVEYVGTNAFQYCYNLKLLNFTQKLKTIEQSAFLGVTRTAGANQYNRIDLLESLGDLSGVEMLEGDSWCNNRGSLSGTFNFNKLNRFPQMGKYTYYDIVLDWDKLTKDRIVDRNNFSLMFGLTKVGNLYLDHLSSQMFYACINLKGVGDMPNLTAIPEYAFMECISLQSVGNIDNVTSIGKGAFRYTQQLSEIKIPNVKTLGQIAFEYSGMEVINLPNVETMGEQAFNHCYKLKQIKGLDKLTEVKGWVFSNCPKLKYLYLPNVNTVEQGAFLFTHKNEGEQGYEYNTEDTEERTIEFALPYEQITWNLSGDLPFAHCKYTTIICGGQELTAEQYTALGAVKPNSEETENLPTEK